MRCLVVALTFFAVTAVACSPGPTPPTVPTPALRLRYFPPDQVCFFGGVPPRLTFRIDPAAEEPVLLEGILGRRYLVWWADGFHSGPAGNPVVVDPTGLVVARDGDLLITPGGGIAELHGYKICAGEAIYVFLEPAR